MIRSNHQVVVGAIAATSFIGIQMSLLATALNIQKNRNTRRFSNIPNIATSLNCFIGTIYAVMIHDAWLLIANFSGWCIAMYCVAIYIYYSPQRDSNYIFGSLIVKFIVATLGVYDKINVVGWVMMVGAVVMMASPLATISEVISMNSLESMPFPLSAACFLNGLTWCLYGMLRNDMFIAVPNGLGTLCALAQLYVWALYCPYPEGDHIHRSSRGSTGSRGSAGLRRQGSYLIVSDDDDDDDDDEEGEKSGSDYSFDETRNEEGKRDETEPSSVQSPRRTLSRVCEEDTFEGELMGSPHRFSLRLSRSSEEARWSNTSNISDLTWATSTKSHFPSFFPLPAGGYGSVSRGKEEQGDHATAAVAASSDDVEKEKSED